jgi:hypothetical protein
MHGIVSPASVDVKLPFNLMTHVMKRVVNGSCRETSRRGHRYAAHSVTERAEWRRITPEQKNGLKDMF